MYTFTVTVENGVSDQETRGKHLWSCKLTTTTTEGSMLNQNYCIMPDLLIIIIMTFLLYPGPSPPHGVQTFCSVVGWRVPLNPNGKIIGYDVQLMGPEDGDSYHVVVS